MTTINELGAPDLPGRIYRKNRWAFFNLVNVAYQRCYIALKLPLRRMNGGCSLLHFFNLIAVNSLSM